MQYAIRVLNLSLGAPARSRYWDDPLNKAVMRAWQSGIVVVVSAGNSGPLPQTVGVPGNVPYVITVGAMTDNYTTSKNDDRLASFSSTGPTFEGFVKPDLVAPGGHVWGFMGDLPEDRGGSSDLHEQRRLLHHVRHVAGGGGGLGCRRAGAVSDNPSLTPDQVKCRIIASGKPAVNADGTLAYSVLQQGTGLVDAKARRERHGQQLRQPGSEHQRRSRRHAALHGQRASAGRRHLQVTSPNGSLLGPGLHLGPGLYLGTRATSGPRVTLASRATSGPGLHLDRQVTTSRGWTVIPRTSAAPRAPRARCPSTSG